MRFQWTLAFFVLLLKVTEGYAAASNSTTTTTTATTSARFSLASFLSPSFSIDRVFSLLKSIIDLTYAGVGDSEPTRPVQLLYNGVDLNRLGSCSALNNSTDAAFLFPYSTCCENLGAFSINMSVCFNCIDFACPCVCEDWRRLNRTWNESTSTSSSTTTPDFPFADVVINTGPPVPPPSDSGPVLENSEHESILFNFNPKPPSDNIQTSAFNTRPPVASAYPSYLFAFSSYAVVLSFGLPCISIVAIISVLIIVTFCCQSSASKRRASFYNCMRRSPSRPCDASRPPGDRASPQSNPLNNPSISFIYLNMDAPGSGAKQEIAPPPNYEDLIKETKANETRSGPKSTRLRLLNFLNRKASLSVTSRSRVLIPQPGEAEAPAPLQNQADSAPEVLEKLPTYNSFRLRNETS